jgi:GxxExxY protein
MVIDLNHVTGKIIRAAINVHSEIGPGLLESVYALCMMKEMKILGLEVVQEVPLPVMYKGERITDDGFRVDFVVEGQVLVELKSVEVVQPVHLKQLLTYLRLAGKHLGLLINFNETLIKNGIHRVVDKLPDRPENDARI